METALLLTAWSVSETVSDDSARCDGGVSRTADVVDVRAGAKPWTWDFRQIKALYLKAQDLSGWNIYIVIGILGQIEPSHRISRFAALITDGKAISENGEFSSVCRGTRKK